MSGRSKVVSDKTEFLNFQPDKCPMSGAISRLEQQPCTKTIVQNVGENNVELACETKEGSEVTRPDASSKQPDINKHSNTEANIRENRKKMEKKSKPKFPTQSPNQPTVNANTSDGVMNTSTCKLKS